MRLTVVLVALTACASNTGAPTQNVEPEEPDLTTERKLPGELASFAATLVHANNQFACDLYAELASQPGNHVFSPFSIATALAMTDAGAAGDTDAELRAALHLTLPADRGHATFGALLDSLDRGRSQQLYTLTTANGVFSQIGSPLVPGFTQTLTTDYAATTTQVDFLANPGAARTQINTWVADQTETKIRTLFGPDQITDQTRLVLANAILFKGAWRHQFDPARTTAKSFQLATGETVDVPTMYKSDDIATLAITGGVLGILPFRGKDLSLVIALPDQAGGLPAVEAQLTADAIADWMSRALPAEFRPVELPKFSLSSAPDLGPILQHLGITSAFDPTTADFSNIDGTRNLYVQTVAHQAVIDVTEDGAEAAAATGVGAGVGSAPTPLVADHPFVFFLYDHVTGEVLFLGRVTDPRP